MRLTHHPLIGAGRLHTKCALKFQTTLLSGKEKPYLYHSMTNETHKTLLSVHERLFGDRSEFPTKDMGWAF